MFQFAMQDTSCLWTHCERWDREKSKIPTEHAHSHGFKRFEGEEKWMMHVWPGIREKKTYRSAPKATIGNVPVCFCNLYDFKFLNKTFPKHNVGLMLTASLPLVAYTLKFEWFYISKRKCIQMNLELRALLPSAVYPMCATHILGLD